MNDKLIELNQNKKNLMKNLKKFPNEFVHEKKAKAGVVIKQKNKGIKKY
jgi:hypothetical protein